MILRLKNAEKSADFSKVNVSKLHDFYSVMGGVVEANVKGSVTRLGKVNAYKYSDLLEEPEDVKLLKERAKAEKIKYNPQEEDDDEYVGNGNNNADDDDM